MPGMACAHGLELDHLGGQVEDRLGDLVLLAAPTPCRRASTAPAPPATRRRTSAPGRSATPGRRGARRRGTRGSGALPVAGGRIRGCVVGSSLTPVLLTPVPFLQHLHAAEAGDAVGDVDDVVALVQVEEAVDGPRLEPPARARRRAPSRPAAAGRGGTARGCRARRRPAPTRRKPARTWPVTSCSRCDSASCAGLEHVGEPVALGLGLAGDQHAVAAGRRRRVRRGRGGRCR